MIDSVKLVQFLKEKKYSGEELADVFGVSRAAIWKKVKKLQEAGYEIITDKEGYQITSSPDKVIPEEVLPHLTTKFIGHNYIYFEEITSTNDYIKSREFPDGTVVVAETQTAGKGRKGRKWVSFYGKGLYFSVILKPHIEVSFLSKLSLVFVYAVFEALKSYIPQKFSLKIKWPNDIYLSGKKLAGFLIDTAVENNEITKVIVGVGININNQLESLQGLDIATSLKIEIGQDFDRKQILADIIKQIETEYYQFLDTKFFDIKKIESNLLWLGENIKVVENGKVLFEGVIEGLNDDGALKIKSGGEVKLIYVGELSVRA